MHVAPLELGRAGEEAVAGEAVVLVVRVAVRCVRVPVVERGELPVLEVEAGRVAVSRARVARAARPALTAEPEVEPIADEQFPLLGKSVAVLLRAAFQNVVDLGLKVALPISRAEVVVEGYSIAGGSALAAGSALSPTWTSTSTPRCSASDFAIASASSGVAAAPT